MGQNNNPLIEQFQAEVASKGNITSNESWNSIPMILFRTVASTGWGVVMGQINNTQGLQYKTSGNELCLFAINVMANDLGADIKISETTLDVGVECLKSLLEMTIDVQCDVLPEQIEYNTSIAKEFLDFWKERLKCALKQEGRLL